MATVFEVSSRDDQSSLRLEELDSDYFLAELRGLNLTARARVGIYMSSGLAALFAEMAAQWRGWSEAKSWQSLEGELRLSAESDRTGHICLTVTLCEGAPAVWSVVAEITLEAGQLDIVARRALTFEQTVLRAG